MTLPIQLQFYEQTDRSGRSGQCMVCGRGAGSIVVRVGTQGDNHLETFRPCSQGCPQNDRPSNAGLVRASKLPAGEVPVLTVEEAEVKFGLDPRSSRYSPCWRMNGKLVREVKRDGVRFIEVLGGPPIAILKLK